MTLAKTNYECVLTLGESTESDVLVIIVSETCTLTDMLIDQGSGQKPFHPLKLEDSEGDPVVFPLTVAAGVHSFQFIGEPFSGVGLTLLGVNMHGVSSVSLEAVSVQESGVYEPIITKSIGYAKWSGTEWTFANETYSLASHTHAGVYEPANANIQSHIASTSNPHSVTYSQVGAAAAAHDHTGVYEPANANIQSHISSTSNPHSVTYSQVGAAAAAHTHSGVYGELSSGNTWTSTNTFRNSTTFGEAQVQMVS